MEGECRVLVVCFVGRIRVGIVGEGVGRLGLVICVFSLFIALLGLFFTARKNPKNVKQGSLEIT